MKKEIKHLISEINKVANKTKSDWWNNYLQHTISFIGVGIPDIRKILKTWNANYAGKTDLSSIADDLIKLDIAEYKLAGILIYQEFILFDKSNEEILTHVNGLFEKEYIYDWNTCDWLCVKVLSNIIDSGDKKLINRILEWSKMENLWHSRASLVAFTQCKSLKENLPKLEMPMKRVIKRNERFAKTSVGWILREIYKFNKTFVKNFLKENKRFLTKEVVNNALKYMDKDQKRRFVLTLG